MRRFYRIVRSALLWLASILYFFVVCPLLVVTSFVLDPKKHDRPQRWFARSIMRVAGARVEVRRAAGFDPQRTCIFVSNHVNIFDPFVLYSAIPQFTRGWELESHFKIPFYGWMMKRFGNIPVSRGSSPADLKKLFQQTRAALEQGISIVVFAEGGRTRDGHVKPFRPGIFRMVGQLGYPIVPVSMVGSYTFYHKGSWMLRPARIVVHLHDTIETKGLGKQDAEALQERVHQIVAGPVEEFWKARAAALETMSEWSAEKSA